MCDSLPPNSDLFRTLRTFHAETAAANLEALNVPKYVEATKAKYNWLHWMPSVGVTLGKPTISFSLGQVAANIENKALRKAAAAELEFSREAERRKILRGGDIAFKSDSFTLVSLLEKHEMLRKWLYYLESIERIENKQFEIQKAKNTEGSILPIDFLQIEAAHLKSGEPYRARLEEIELLEIEVRKTAKY
jgi:hypothetical protein